MVIRYCMKTWVKTIVTLVLAFTLGWFVVTRDIITENGIFQATLDTVKVTTAMDTPTGDTNATRNMTDWSTVNLESKEIPQSVILKKSDVVVTTQTVRILDMDIFVRQSLPPSGATSSGQTILLLHGQRFSSQNWEDLGTLSLMAALGHRVVAIDLPGYGKSGTKHFSGDRAKFLQLVLTALELSKPVMVSPSMSGQYSLKFLELYSGLLSGFVPVAPVETNRVNASLFKEIKFPALLVYGDNDKTGLASQEARDALRVLPNSREVRLKDAGHAAYLDQPEIFHKIMFNFMELLHVNQ